eukprot:353764_1
MFHLIPLFFICKVRIKYPTAKIWIRRPKTKKGLLDGDDFEDEWDIQVQYNKSNETYYDTKIIPDWFNQRILISTEDRTFDIAISKWNTKTVKVICTNDEYVLWMDIKSSHCHFDPSKTIKTIEILCADKHEAKSWKDRFSCSSDE